MQTIIRNYIGMIFFFIIFPVILGPNVNCIPQESGVIVVNGNGPSGNAAVVFICHDYSKEDCNPLISNLGDNIATKLAKDAYGKIYKVKGTATTDKSNLTDAFLRANNNHSAYDIYIFAHGSSGRFYGGEATIYSVNYVRDNSAHMDRLRAVYQMNCYGSRYSSYYKMSLSDAWVSYGAMAALGVNGSNGDTLWPIQSAQAIMAHATTFGDEWTSSKSMTEANAAANAAQQAVANKYSGFEMIDHGITGDGSITIDTGL